MDKSVAKHSRPSDVKRKPINISHSGQIDACQLRRDSLLPLLIRPAVTTLDVVEWLGNNRDWLTSELFTHGAILFRDFDVNTLEDFERFIETLSSELLDYSYRSTPRSHLSGKIY